MKINHCAICRKKIYKAYTCKSCQQKYDLKEAWVVKLIGSEKRWRALLERDDRKKLITFSDIQLQNEGEKMNGWDVVNETDVTNIFSDDEMLPQYDDLLLLIFSIDPMWYIKKLSKEFQLTTGEQLAFMTYSVSFLNGLDKPMSSHEAAALLSEAERKHISPAAYRQRIRMVRKKLAPLRKYREKIRSKGEMPFIGFELEY